jgi:hypothetical protein
MGQISGLSDDGHSLLVYTYSSGKTMEQEENKKLKEKVNELNYKNNTQKQKIQDIKTSLEGIFMKLCLRHKSTFPQTEIYKRLGLDGKTGQNFILTYDECMNENLFYGFLHLFVDHLIYESVVIPGEMKKFNFKDFEKIIKCEKDGKDGILIFTKDQGKFMLYGFENRDATLEKCLKASGLDYHEEDEYHHSDEEN